MEEKEGGDVEDVIIFDISHTTIQQRLLLQWPMLKIRQPQAGRHIYETNGISSSLARTEYLAVACTVYTEVEEEAGVGAASDMNIAFVYKSENSFPVSGNMVVIMFC